MKKKILHVTTISPTLGFLTEHIRFLLKQGNEVELASNITSKLSNGIEEQNIDVNQIDFQRRLISLDNLKAYSQIKELQKNKKYDIVHVHTPIAAFITRIALRGFRKKNNLKVVYTAHGFHFYKGAPLKNWLLYYTAEKVASKWTDIIITMNAEDYHFASQKLSGNGKIKVFKVGGIGVNIDEYSHNDEIDLEIKTSLGLDKNDFVISVIGELSHRKNQIQLIKAIGRIKCRYKDIKLVIVGSGSLLEDYKRYVYDNNLEKNIIFLGYRKDIPKILDVTDVLGLVSLHEGLPRNLMEAMCNKKAILCTNIRGNVDLVKHEENGLIVEVGDIESTYKSIIKLYENRDLIKSMGEKSFKYIQNFSEEKVLKEMESIYENII